MSTPSNLLKKMLFVGGKGGVGKTTVSAALSLMLSKKGKCVLISTDPAHSLSHLLEVDPSSEKRAIQDNLTLWGLHAQEEYQLFMEKHEEDFRVILDTSTYLDDTDINQFLGLAIPGIDEIMGFKSIVDLVKANEYEYFIIDTAPTGHAMRLLFIPEVLNEWIKQIAALRWKYRQVQKTFAGKYTPDSGDDMLLELKKSVLKIKDILGDPEQSEFVIVSKAEKVVFDETVDLKKELEEHQIAINHLIINNVMSTSWQGEFCQKVATYQKPWIGQLKESFADQTITELPLYPHPITGLTALEQLSEPLANVTI